MPARGSDNGESPDWVEKVLPTDLGAVRAPVSEALSLLKQLGYDEDDRFGVRLAMEEALVNAMKHGNRMDPARKVRLSYLATADRIEIRIADEGVGFNPCAIPDPTVDENLQRPCGRGIMLMRSYMDEVSYALGGREARMVKHRRTAPDGGKPETAEGERTP